MATDNNSREHDSNNNSSSSDSNRREYTWSTSQFGLYRYYEEDEADNTYYSTVEKKRGGVKCLIVFVVCSFVLTFVICFLLYGFLNDPPPLKELPVGPATTSEPPPPLPSLEPPLESSEKLIGNMLLPPLLAKRRNSIKYRAKPRPFRYETRGPRPTGFRPSPPYHDNDKYAQLINYRHSGGVRSIQDIIEYLGGEEGGGRSYLFSGRYHRLGGEDSGPARIVNEQPVDLFRAFKPANPSDVNLLAPRFFRFAPQVHHEDTLLPLPSRSPLSVTLDIYPMGKKQRPLSLQQQTQIYSDIYHNGINTFWGGDDPKLRKKYIFPGDGEEPHLDPRTLLRLNVFPKTERKIDHFPTIPCDRPEQTALEELEQLHNRSVALDKLLYEELKNLKSSLSATTTPTPRAGLPTTYDQYLNKPQTTTERPASQPEIYNITILRGYKPIAIDIGNETVSDIVIERKKVVDLTNERTQLLRENADQSESREDTSIYDY